MHLMHDGTVAMVESGNAAADTANHFIIKRVRCPGNCFHGDHFIPLLMGDQVEPRKQFILENSDLVKDLDV